ncbi:MULTISPECIES: hypothetical protein [unclassified Oceanispirochaeta]|uniref:hypothetical protein n=1 Tax=unclassified Oceanispirochaeta TaxID=2635722 RepID=UPI0018AA78B1|nr:MULTISPECIES: hypothetical protein [unclassified Oceanispirochaeta]NPD72733.1 hypothetical protein [Oceanispirochaeta sp. M1]
MKILNSIAPDTCLRKKEYADKYNASTEEEMIRIAQRTDISVKNKSPLFYEFFRISIDVQIVTH